MYRRFMILVLLIVTLMAWTGIAPAFAVEPDVSASACRADPPAIAAPLPVTAPDTLKVTIVSDNYTKDEASLVSDWGFAAWLEYKGHTILFDTGDNGTILLHNLKQLGLDPRKIEAVIISHEHHDHFGGLQSLLDAGVKVPVYMACQFTGDFKDSISSQTKVVEVSDVTEIVPGMRMMKPFGCIVEQSMEVDTPQGTVVITGCAHPGVANIVREAEALTAKPIALVVGGFHFFPLDTSALPPLVKELKTLGVQKIMPTHCSGDPAIELFKAEFKDAYIPGGVGVSYTVGQAG